MSQPSGTCPVCKKPFKKGDDIVTCPSCGAQYHRACYQEAGDCVFSAQHGSGFEYKPPRPKEEPTAAKNEGGVLCPHCKTVNDAQGIFCENCGQPLHAQAPDFGAKGAGAPPPPPPQYGPFNPFGGPQAAGGYGPQRQYSGTIDGIPANEWAEFIGNSAPVYLSRLTAMERSKGKISFMFSAFFITPMYFAYRKMWFWTAITLLGTVLFWLPQVFLAAAAAGIAVPFGLSVATWEVVVTVVYYLNIVMKLAFGMFSLLLYRRFASKKMAALRQQADGDTAYHDALVRKGGTSVPGVLLAFGVLFAVVSLLYVFAGDAMMAWYTSFFM